MKDYYPVINGKTVHIRASSREDLQNRIAKKQAEASVPTLSEYADTWFRRKLDKPDGKRIRATTIEEYRTHISRIKRFFKDVPLTGITTVSVQAFADWLAAGKKNGFRTDISEKTIERTLGTLKQIMTEAVEVEELIPKMPYKPKLIVNNGPSSSHHKALPPDLYAQVLQTIPGISNDKERMFMALLATTGMRPEEIYGLRWEDVSPNWDFIHVCRSVTYPTKNKPVVNQTKTESSNRYVNLLGWVSDILKPYARAAGFIFGGEAPLCYATRSRLQKNAWQSSGLKNKGVCPYDFRANFATMLCEHGQTDKQVADLMGHADTRMVDTVYAPARKEGILMHKCICENLFGRQ